MLDAIVIVIACILVMWTNKRIGERHGPVHGPWYKRTLDRLFLYHCLFTCVFPLIPGDAIGYWRFNFQQLTVHSEHMGDYFGVGTVFLLWLDFIPVKVLGLSFFTGNVLYGICGFLGLRFLFLLFVETLKVNVRVLGLEVIPFLFYLPNINFWTSGVGKDALSFFGIAWFFYGLAKYKKRLPQMIISVLLVYFIRPHMALMIGVSVCVAIIFSGEMKALYKAFFILLAVGGIAMVYRSVAIYLMVKDLDVASLKDLAKGKASLLSTSTSGSSVDISQYSEPMRLFTYLFRPMFFDAHNAISLLSSFENVIYLVITVIGCRAIRRRDLAPLPLWLKSGFILFVTSMIVFANSLGNLGIIMREKNMTMIYLLMVCVWVYSRRRSESLSANPVLQSNSI